MQNETKVSPANRYLMLAANLSCKTFEQEKVRAIQWSTRNRSKLGVENFRALDQLAHCRLDNMTAALVVVHCYADISIGRRYTRLFDLNDYKTNTTTEAALQFGIFWGQMPIEDLQHGHHQLAIFKFPQGIPPLLASLPTNPEAGQKLGLCDATDWPSISQNQSRVILP